MWDPGTRLFPVAPLPARQVTLTLAAPTCPHSHLCDHKTPQATHHSLPSPAHLLETLRGAKGTRPLPPK